MATIACTETYEDFRLMVCQAAWRYKRTYGGDFEDWMSEGNAIFMRAYRTWNRDKKFSTWLGFLLNKLMMEKVRRQCRKSAKLKQVAHDLGTVYARESFNWQQFSSELSEDARTVVGLVFEPNNDVRLSLIERKRETPKTIRESVQEFLQDMGWTSERIWKSFSEIGEAL